VTAAKRLSQAISEGGGISLIVEVEGPEAARSAEEEGADAVVVSSGQGARLEPVAHATSLPVLFYFDGGRAEAVPAADACVVHGDVDWLERVHLELADAVELAVRIDDDEQLEEVLERFDPELLVLAADGRDRLERVLHLLSVVPAGKLAIAELGGVTRDEIRELERAGCDAVLVGAATPAV